MWLIALFAGPLTSLNGRKSFVLISHMVPRQTTTSFVCVWEEKGGREGGRGKGREGGGRGGREGEGEGGREEGEGGRERKQKE